MNKLKLSLIVALLTLAAAALAQTPHLTPFSADLSTSSGGGHESTGKIYVGEQKIRMDMNTPGHSTGIITDMATQTSYVLMPQQKMYMEINSKMKRDPHTPDLRAYDPSNPCATQPDMTCKKAGTETVNGRSCDKWEFTSKSRGQTQTVWIDQKLHFPIKTVSSDGGLWELKNVKEGAPDASLFQIPAGYQKMDMGGMMGQPR